MKIVITHNYYGSDFPSGENIVFESERRLLKRQGHDVNSVCRNSDDIRARGVWGMVQGALSTPWNPFSAQKIRKTVEVFKPDVVHVHNTFPLLSPSIFHAIGSRSARVLTLHNYRLFCPAAIPMRKGEVCTQCLDLHSVIPSLQHGCYRGSRVATFPLAVNVELHRKLGTWVNQIDGFIALTEFQREVMINAGLPSELVHVKPNFFPGTPEVNPWSKRRPGVVFVGRLSEEKGIMTLVRAWLKWGTSAPELRIIGDGPLLSELEKIVSASPDIPIVLTGRLSSKMAQNEIANARLMLLPSECFEGFPMVLVEAFALGTPVAVSDIGPLPGIVNVGQNGVIFSPKDPVSLLEAVRSVWESKNTLERLGSGARAAFLRLYSEEVNYAKLLSIYNQAIQVSQQRSLSR